MVGVRILRIALAVIWLACGAYVSLASFLGLKLIETSASASVAAAGGYVSYGGLTFKTQSDLEAFLLDETATSWFPWLPGVPRELIPFLVSVSLGALGAAVRLLNPEIGGKPDEVVVCWAKLLLSPIQGASIALALYMLTFLVPAVLTVGTTAIRAEALAAVAFFAGFGGDVISKWIYRQVEKLVQ